MRALALRASPQKKPTLGRLAKTDDRARTEALRQVEKKYGVSPGSYDYNASPTAVRGSWEDANKGGQHVIDYFPLPSWTPTGRSRKDKSTFYCCRAVFLEPEIKSRDGTFRLELSVVMIPPPHLGAELFSFRLESGDEKKENAQHSFTHFQLSQEAIEFYDDRSPLRTALPKGLGQGVPTVPVQCRSGREVWLTLLASIYGVNSNPAMGIGGLVTDLLPKGDPEFNPVLSSLGKACTKQFRFWSALPS